MRKIGEKLRPFIIVFFCFNLSNLVKELELPAGSVGEVKPVFL
jgi:hypothetical protein